MLFSPRFILGSIYTDQLGLTEALLYCNTRILPPRIDLQIEYPHLAEPKGHAVVIDLDCPGMAADSYLASVLLAGTLKFNVTPHLYSLGGEADGGRPGQDRSGLRAASWVQVAGLAHCALAWPSCTPAISHLHTVWLAQLAMVEMVQSPLNEIKRCHISAYLSTEVEYFVRNVSGVSDYAFDGEDTAETREDRRAAVEQLLRSFEGVDVRAFHGIVELEQLERVVSASSPGFHDYEAARRTHCVIVCVPDGSVAVSAARAAEAAATRSKPVYARSALSGMWRPATGTEVGPQPTESMPSGQDATADAATAGAPAADLDALFAELDESLGDRAMPAAAGSSDDALPRLSAVASIPVTPTRARDSTSQDATESAYVRPQQHNFLVAWRHGPYPVVRRAWGRKSLGDVAGQAATASVHAHAAARAAAFAAAAKPQRR